MGLHHPGHLMDVCVCVCLCQEEVRQLVRAKQHKLVRAFSVLQERRRDCEEPVVSQAVWKQLVQLVRPGMGSGHRELLWSVLDHQNQGCIGNAHTHTHSFYSSSTCLKMQMT